jgi:uncharacterized membrane protein (DUF4010 family)
VFETARPFLLAIAIGLIIGIERERAHADHKIEDPLGSRSFTLLSLLGAIAAYVESTAVAAILAGFAGAIVLAGYLRTRVEPEGHGVGATTEVAAMVTFAFGYLVRFQPPLTLMLAVITVVVLALKPRIHHFAQAGLSQSEVSAALTVLVIAFVVLPLLPNRTLDPWNLINPFRLWLLFALITGIAFGSYIAVRLLGPERGYALAGLFGGFVSSTAATLSLSQKTREGAALPGAAAVGIVLANTTSAAAQIIVVGVTNPAMTADVLPVIGGPVLVGALGATAAMAYLDRRARAEHADTALVFSNPLAIKASAKFAAVVAIVLVAATAASRWFGTAGVLSAAILGGTSDVHAVSLAVSALAASGGVPVREAVLAILLAFVANMVVKLSIVAWVGGRRLLATVAPPALAMMAAGVAAFLHFHR